MRRRRQPRRDPGAAGAERRDWPQLRVVRLRANAGHQAALSAGLARARGAWVATIDADLQDPPEVLPEMLARRHGPSGSTSSTACATTAAPTPPFKRVTARLYYRMMRRAGRQSRAERRRRLPADEPGDGRRRQRAARSTTGCCGWSSRRSASRAREVATGARSGPPGATKYPLSRMVRLSVDSLTGFSSRRCAWRPGSGSAVRSSTAPAPRLRGRSPALTGHGVPGWTSTRRRRRRGRRPAALPRHARRVRRAALHPDAGPALVLRGPRQPGRRRCGPRLGPQETLTGPSGRPHRSCMIMAGGSTVYRSRCRRSKRSPRTTPVAIARTSAANRTT